MHLVDVHAHLDHEQFADDLPDVISRAKARGVVCVIAQGINHESNQAVLDICAKHPLVKAALGIYPTESMGVQLVEGASRTTAYDEDKTLEFIERNADRIIAIGEVGMDFQESKDAKNQEELFRKVIRLAKRIKKPLIIHSRKAEKEVLDLLEDEEYTRAVMHCFTGSKKLLERGVKMGLYFSIPTAVTRNQQFQENARIVPLNQLFTETDAPFMAPMKDLRNEPANIRDAILKIAELKRLDPEECANAIYFNYQKLFQ